MKKTKNNNVDQMVKEIEAECNSLKDELTGQKKINNKGDAIREQIAELAAKVVAAASPEDINDQNDGGEGNQVSLAHRIKKHKKAKA